MRLVLIGPPGVGKGTQAVILGKSLGIPHISTGDLFRDHVTRRTPLGREAGHYLDTGELVPDHITVGMVHERLALPDARRGFMLDGFPRTVPQACDLTGVLDGTGARLDAVLEFTAPEDILVARLLKRGRPDDTEDVIRHRQQVYHHETAPLLDHYADILLTVEATGHVEDIAARALKELESVRA
jgi:adenylate kinase